MSAVEALLGLLQATHGDIAEVVAVDRNAAYRQFVVAVKGHDGVGRIVSVPDADETDDSHLFVAACNEILAQRTRKATADDAAILADMAANLHRFSGRVRFEQDYDPIRNKTRLIGTVRTELGDMREVDGRIDPDELDKMMEPGRRVAGPVLAVENLADWSIERKRGG
jgi:hypothetical protein